MSQSGTILHTWGLELGLFCSVQELDTSTTVLLLVHWYIISICAMPVKRLLPNMLSNWNMRNPFDDKGHGGK